MSLLRTFFAFVLVGTASGNEFFIEYFSLKSVTAVTSTLCTPGKNIWLYKQFSERKIRFDCLDLGRFNETEAIKRLTSKFFKHGVLVDLKCPRSMDLLKMADKHDLFTFSTSLTLWVVVTENHFSKETLETLTGTHTPEANDPIQFLTLPYQDRKNEKYLFEINKKVNLDFIKSYKKHLKNIRKQAKQLPEVNKTEIHDFLNMKLLMDNDIALAIPESSPHYQYTLYAIYKPTVESRLEVRETARVTKDGRLEMRGATKRKNLGNGILRAVSAVFQPETFTTIDDLATRETDIWAKLSYPHLMLLAEDLNFRVIIRFFDDYGWQTNGTFGHLMGFLQEKKADLSAAPLMIRTDRLGIVDFLKCPFRLQTGILFREPSLSSVSNIFLLPFSRAIWVSIGIVIVLTAVALRCRIMAGKTLIPPDEYVASFFDIAHYIVGAVCQQGFSATPKSLSARITLIIILLTSVALFTSYSASIVALLQSSSTAIATIRDLTQSNLEVGIQANFPFYRVLMQESSHPTLKEFYHRKVLPKGEKAYWDKREGIEKMRTGMFAFEVEVTAGYKLISETYKEREKCGIKEIDPIPKPFICMAVLKFSPYKEIFTERWIWQEETGFFDRSWKLWVDQKPTCEVGRIGFISVGLVEFGPALQVFAYGVLASGVIFFTELLYGRKRKKI